MLGTLPRTLRDHPRSRGVYLLAYLMWETPNGSSPLARGLLEEIPEPTTVTRIIPARAGFTLDTKAGVLDNRDHPRSRGVYSTNSGTSRSNLGSSPLARGLRPRLRRGGQHHRIIPARAGFTGHFSVPSRGLGDHPRSRGVYTLLAVGGFVLSGSSPLARGLLAFDGSFILDYRIIPARAGFTSPGCGG